MSAARLSHVVDADFAEIGDQRRTDRRAGDRRATRLKLDPLFAATLVNQVARAEKTPRRAYAAPRRRPPRGLVVNFEA
jgi:hypothetical protein